MKTIFTNEPPNAREQIFFIEKTVELDPVDYADFQSHHLAPYPFLKGLEEYSYTDHRGLAHCLLLLCEGDDDGILVLHGGPDSLLRVASLPCARQIALLQKYPSLDRHMKTMGELVDYYANEVIKQPTDADVILDGTAVLDRVERQQQAFNEILFADMMVEHPGIENIDSHQVGYVVTKAKQPDAIMRILNQADVDIMCANHTLWIHGRGGKQADFSRCLLRGIDLSHRNLCNAIFDETILQDVDLTASNISQASFVRSQITGTNFDDAHAVKAIWRGANLHRCRAMQTNFSRGDFCDAVFTDSIAEGASFSDCRTDGADLRDVMDDLFDDGDIGMSGY